jgi:hypothetical protein
LQRLHITFGLDGLGIAASLRKFDGAFWRREESKD